MAGKIVVTGSVFVGMAAESNQLFRTYNKSTTLPAKPATAAGTDNGWSPTNTDGAVWVCEKSALSILEGTWGDVMRFKGEAGSRGMLPYPAGEYSTSTVYTATASTAPYVLIAGTYYVMNKVGNWLGTTTGKTPAQDYATNGVNATWIPFENYKAIYVELLMVKLGLIGKAVFYDEFMFSQHGTDTNGNPSTKYQGFADGTFTPNLILDFLNGRMTAKDATIGGTIDATNGTIGGFEIGESRIGAEDTSDGLSILSSFIKYSRQYLWSGIGADVFPSTTGITGLARHEMDYTADTSGSAPSGVALYTKARFPKDGMDSWITRRSHWNEGNVFSVGGHCQFDDTYIGAASTNVLENLIGLTHTYVFTSIPSAYLNVNLPTKAMIDAKTGGRNVSFELKIQIAWLDNTNKIRINGVDSGFLVGSVGDRPHGGNGWLDMSKCESLVLRWLNGNFYIVSYPGYHS